VAKVSPKTVQPGARPSAKLIRLAHVNFSAAILKMGFVHVQVDEKDASSVLGGNMLALERALYLGRIEAFSFVPDDDQDSLRRVTATADPNLFAGIAMIPVDNRVRQSFVECCFNGEFVFTGATARRKYPHELFHDGIDGVDFAVN
jgi:hypothetical protein